MADRGASILRGILCASAFLLATAAAAWSAGSGVAEAVSGWKERAVSDTRGNDASAETPPAAENLPDGLYARMITSKGEILLWLEFEKTPMTVANFVGLSEGALGPAGQGGRRKPFYDGLTFHRVIADFMIQGGDPTGTGSGGPGYKFPDEFVFELRHSGPGILSMANSGPGTNGSQFFITHKGTPWLDGKHTVFGHVVQGQDVVNAIRQGDRIERVEIVRVGAKAKAFTVTQESFNALVADAPERARRMAEERKKRDSETVAKRWPDAVVTASGLRYIVLKKGTGSGSPIMGTQVTVNYVGQLLDGTTFDSSIDRGKPAVFKVGQVIPGWNEALMAMKKGEKRLLIIPPALGYGTKGYPGVIPPDSWLVFEVELIDF